MSETKSFNVLTTVFGISVDDDQNSRTAKERGPVPDPSFLEPPFEVSGLAAHTPYRYPTMTLYSQAICTVIS